MFGSKEKNTVELKVEGMTCGHCEMHIKSALEKVDGVKSAKADKDKKNAVVQLKDGADVDVNILINAVNETGYKAAV